MSIADALLLRKGGQSGEVDVDVKDSEKNSSQDIDELTPELSDAILETESVQEDEENQGKKKKAAEMEVGSILTRILVLETHSCYFFFCFVSDTLNVLEF